MYVGESYGNPLPHGNSRQTQQPHSGFIASRDGRLLMPNVPRISRKPHQDKSARAERVRLSRSRAGSRSRSKGRQRPTLGSGTTASKSRHGFQKLFSVMWTVEWTNGHHKRRNWPVGTSTTAVHRSQSLTEPSPLIAFPLNSSLTSTLLLLRRFPETLSIFSFSPCT